jgi:hypothetical protein
MKRSDLDEAAVMPRSAVVRADRRAALPSSGVLQDDLPPAAPAPEILGSRAFFLFLPYYTPPDADRAAELVYCLKRNLDSGLFARIVLMIDDDTPLPFQDWRLLGIRLNRRPTYLDWVRTARRLCPGHVAVLLNSDIHVDSSFASIAEIFRHDDRAFVALSRFDKKGDDLVPHSDPHWSQDTWAYVPALEDDTSYDAQLDVPLGVPRCDNKIAYLFGIQGYTIYNPFPFVRTVHVHETGRRYYNKKGDRRIIGGVAYVHPSAALTEPASLDLDIWSIRTVQLKKVRINASIEKWADEERLAGQQWPTWIAHDADWQYPAVTEQHAFLRMRDELPPTREGRACLYLAFPFATLIDLHRNLGPKHARTRELQVRLEALAERAKGYDRVTAVCQHMRAKEFAGLFTSAGITDLFWSHAVKDEPAFTVDRMLKVHPFPLYPVQQVRRGLEDIGRPRRWLYSFAGAHKHQGYLTQVRAMIMDMLAGDPRGCVMGRDGWHYEKVVYQAQVLGKVASSEAGLVNDEASAEFRDLLDQSVFSLCPSGTGPNSIRLWEAVINGSIPVILSDTWAAPGDPALWQAATVRASETAEEIASLPARLATIAADADRLIAMRKALIDLAKVYGPEGFVGDVLSQYGSP